MPLASLSLRLYNTLYLASRLVLRVPSVSTYSAAANCVYFHYLLQLLRSSCCSLFRSLFAHSRSHPSFLGPVSFVAPVAASLGTAVFVLLLACSAAASRRCAHVASLAPPTSMCRRHMLFRVCQADTVLFDVVSPSCSLVLCFCFCLCLCLLLPPRLQMHTCANCEAVQRPLTVQRVRTQPDTSALRRPATLLVAQLLSLLLTSVVSRYYLFALLCVQ